MCSFADKQKQYFTSELPKNVCHGKPFPTITCCLHVFFVFFLFLFLFLFVCLCVCVCVCVYVNMDIYSAMAVYSSHTPQARTIQYCFYSILMLRIQISLFSGKVNGCSRTLGSHYLPTWITGLQDKYLSYWSHKTFF